MISDECRERTFSVNEEACFGVQVVTKKNTDSEMMMLWFRYISLSTFFRTKRPLLECEFLHKSPRAMFTVRVD